MLQRAQVTTLADARRCGQRIVLLASSASAVPPDVAQATSSFDYTKNMHPQGYSPRANTPNLPGQTFTANSDLAFWGNYAFQGHSNAEEVAFADPAPLVPTQLGGDWSTYWYNGRIYESDITRGLLIWNLSDKAVAGAKKFDHLNPQTMETSFELKG